MIASALDRVTRGISGVITADDLRKKLDSGKKLRIKLGIDPTRRDIHLGFAVVLRKLRLFQDLGHQAVLIVGDATARVGDPSGKSETRPLLGEDEVRANARTYIEQMGKILDLSTLEVRWNGEWFSKLPFLDVIGLASKLTVARMLERDDFSKRLAEGSPIGVHELLYPMMQGYDSVMVRADVELGGTDQLFNLLVGRQMQPDFGQERQVCLMTPLLIGLDGGRKMSKSYDNYIGIAEPPEEQYGKTMSIPDALLGDWFTLLTDVPLAEAEALVRASPYEAKKRLAREIVALYHGNEAAERAAERFRRTVVEKEVPEEIPAFAVAESPVWIVALVADAFKHSRSDARRLIQQGAVSIDGTPIRSIDAKVEVRPGMVLKAGKRHYARLAV